MESNRIILHTVHDDLGATEIYWARTADDHPDASEFNAIQFAKDGSLIFKAHTDDEVPYVTTILENRTVILYTEDMLSMTEIDSGEWGAQECMVFDSAKLEGE